MVSKLKQNQEERLTLVADYSERIQTQKITNRKLQIENEKLKVEKDLNEKETEHLEKELEKLRHKLQKEEMERRTIKERKMESEEELDRIRNDLRKQRDKEETTVKLNMQERENILKKAQDEKDGIQKNYLELFDKHTKLAGKLKELEKQQEISRLEFNQKKGEMERRSSLMEEKLTNKGMYHILRFFYFCIKTIS
jgi:hypothetical protein